MHRRLLALGLAAVLAGGTAATALAHDGEEHPEPAPIVRSLVFNGEGNRLNVYDAQFPSKIQTLHVSAGDAARGATPDGVAWTPESGIQAKDSNAQICFDTLDDGAQIFVVGEDTGQRDQGTGSALDGPVGAAGWGLFELGGDEIGELTSTQVSKLVPNYNESTHLTDANENYGCGFLPNGNLLLTDVGSQRPGEAGSGQLHLWFRDGDDYNDFETSTYSEQDRHPYGNRPLELPIGVPADVDYCLIDTGIPTAGEVEIVTNPLTGEIEVLVASARPGTPSGQDDVVQQAQAGGVWRYTGLEDLTADDCAADEDGIAAVRAPGTHVAGHTDAGELDLSKMTAAQLNSTPLVARGDVAKSLFIFDPANSPTPNGVTLAPNGNLYVSSVFTGTISEYTPLGTFVRRVLTPLPTTPLPPYAETGTPLGLDVDPVTGAIWFADIGIGGLEEAMAASGEVIVDAVTGFDPASLAGLAGAFGHIGPNKEGHVRRIGFNVPGSTIHGVNGNVVPQQPEIIHHDRAFPDGIGVLGLTTQRGESAGSHE